MEVLAHVCPDINTDIVKPNSIKRLGKLDPKNSKPRPVKITIIDNKCKSLVTDNARNLKDFTKYPKIGISIDRTRKEREDYRKLKSQLKVLVDDGNDAYISNNQIIVKNKVTKAVSASEAASVSQDAVTEA